jgi:pilus assembly protein FimV
MSVAASGRWAVASLGVLALSLALATGTARGQGVTDDPGQASAQQATTGQAAMTGADAEDAAPTNIFISLRINSPGDNGPVTQTSTTAVAGEATNEAATAQDAWQHTDAVDEVAQPQPLPQASAQDAATNQAAATNATATRPKPTNVVVSVRVNSPGDDAPVTQSSAVAVGAESKNTAATAQQAQQAQQAQGAAARPAAPAVSAPPAPAPGAVADQPGASAPPAPPTCVRVAPGSAATRIVITIGKSCRQVAAKRAAPPRPRLRTPAPAHAAPPAPAAPVVHQVAAASPAPAASPPPRAAATQPHPAPAKPTLRPHAAESKSLDPLAASTKVGDLVAAAALPPTDGEARYEVMLALLLAMLGAAALWSYGGAHRYYRLRRWR